MAFKSKHSPESPELSAGGQNYINVSDINSENTGARPPENVQGAAEHTPLRCVCHALGVIGATLTFIRNFIANTVMLLILVCIVSFWYLGSEIQDNAKSLFSSMEPQPVHSPVLYMPLRGYVSEMPSSGNDMDLFSMSLKQRLTGIITHEIITIERTLHEAGMDDEIEEVLINIDGMGSISQEKALRIATAMDDFLDAATEEHPKTITVIGTNFSHSAYLIASHANRIIMDPMGTPGIRGITFASLYFRDLLNRLKVQPYIFRAGEYKSAVEPFLRQDMSSEIKDEYTQLALALWQQYYDAVAEGRSALAGGNDKLLPDSVTWLKMLSEAGGSESTLALKMGLVDEVKPLEDVHLENVERCGSVPNNPYVPQYVNYLNYAAGHELLGDEPYQENQVVVLYGLGEITDYSESRGGFTPDNLVPLIREAAGDDEIKAIVLYLNSGGGSVIASEKIRRALEHFKAQGKKLVVSMNGTAASGAYWIACMADKIIASPGTITGSIGVFGMSFGLYGLLNELGVNQDGISTHELADVAIARPLNPVQHQQIELNVESTYKNFVDLVCRERQLPRENYKNFAEGRVFLADKALELGLIDEIGTYDDALNAAMELAEIDPDDTQILQWVPDEEFGLSSFREVLLNGSAAILPESAATALKTMLGRGNTPAAQPELMAISPLKAPEF